MTIALFSQILSLSKTKDFKNELIALILTIAFSVLFQIYSYTLFSIKLPQFSQSYHGTKSASFEKKSKTI